jgi:hypothetical protein
MLMRLWLQKEKMMTTMTLILLRENCQKSKPNTCFLL